MAHFDFKPDADAASPLYLQLAQALARAIAEGRFQADEALPSERQLAEDLGLSRVTARKAIERLAEQGLIQRKRGSGNYIRPRLEQPLTRLSGFSEELNQRGFVPGSRWLFRGFAAAQPDEQLQLELHAGERVARLERQRLADGVVMAYELSALPESALPDPEAVGASLYGHLAKLDRAPVRALQHIRALNADARDEEHRAAGRHLEQGGQARVGYLADGRAVELTHSYCRSDYYDFVVEMKRD